MEIQRVTHDPEVMGGKPCIRGLRVTVATVLGMLVAGQSREAILAAYPYLESADIDAVLAYAAQNQGFEDGAAWDQQIEQDIAAGRLDALADEAIADLKANRCINIPRVAD